MNTEEIQELERQIRLTKTRDFSWYNEKFKENKLRLKGILFTETTFRLFREAVKTVEEIYPNNWDISIKVIEVSEGIEYSIEGIVVHFPEVVVTNQHGRTHNIKDIFVQIPLIINTSNNLSIRAIQGGRMSLSYKEWCSGYSHSHLPKRKIHEEDIAPYWNGFCTGSGLINISLAEINSTGFTTDKFIAFLINLHTLVSWESLEGVPYIKMSTITTLSDPSNLSIYFYNTNKQSIFIDLVKRICRGTPSLFNLNFTIRDSKVYVVEDEVFNIFINVLKNTPNINSDLLCIKDSNIDIYYRKDINIRSVIPPVFTSKFIFKGEEKVLEINDVPTTAQEIEYIIYPKIIKEFIKNLEYVINKNEVRKSTIERYSNQVNTIGEDSKSNTIPMSTGL
jgi:hypothetical protein